MTDCRCNATEQGDCCCCPTCWTPQGADGWVGLGCYDPQGCGINREHEPLPREHVLARKLRFCVIERRLTEGERRELGELNARISYVLNEDCVCPECQWDPPGNCVANETASCPCPCHGDDGVLAVDGIIWQAHERSGA